jgi:hypothetical protein
MVRKSEWYKCAAVGFPSFVHDMTKIQTQFFFPPQVLGRQTDKPIPLFACAFRLLFMIMQPNKRQSQ